ncbi:(E)-beta-farnesene synthase [Linum perenne]
MLSLYEAAYMRIRGETVLDEAIEFTKSHLNDALLVATNLHDSSSSSQLAKRNGHTTTKCVNHKMKMLFEATVDTYNEHDAISSKDGRPYCLEYGKLSVIIFIYTWPFVYYIYT